jgi:hypothetical protein
MSPDAMQAAQTLSSWIIGACQVCMAVAGSIAAFALVRLSVDEVGR